MFQFQYGAIKSYQDKSKHISKFCFNSNMVRLKGVTPKTLRLWEKEFQFQYGAIKSIKTVF